jgi:hypothetical protein
MEASFVVTRVMNPSLVLVKVRTLPLLSSAFILEKLHLVTFF